MYFVKTGQLNQDDLCRNPKIDLARMKLRRELKSCCCWAIQWLIKVPHFHASSSRGRANASSELRSAVGNDAGDVQVNASKDVRIVSDRHKAPSAATSGDRRERMP